MILSTNYTNYHEFKTKKQISPMYNMRITHILRIE